MDKFSHTCMYTLMTDTRLCMTLVHDKYKVSSSDNSINYKQQYTQTIVLIANNSTNYGHKVVVNGKSHFGFLRLVCS